MFEVKNFMGSLLDNRKSNGFDYMIMEREEEKEKRRIILDSIFNEWLDNYGAEEDTYLILEQMAIDELGELYESDINYLNELLKRFA